MNPRPGEVCVADLVRECRHPLWVLCFDCIDVRSREWPGAAGCGQAFCSLEVDHGRAGERPEIIRHSERPVAVVVEQLLEVGKRPCPPRRGRGRGRR